NALREGKSELARQVLEAAAQVLMDEGARFERIEGKLALRILPDPSTELGREAEELAKGGVHVLYSLTRLSELPRNAKAEFDPEGPTLYMGHQSILSGVAC